ncbi:MAG TPA: iron-containing redox enzyme family protein [Marmoricola sp.]|nr:iron-containing redox enzyme family protein [Marmoricola sp.]
MRLPRPRGPLSALTATSLVSGAGMSIDRFRQELDQLAPSCDLLVHDDFQLGLWMLYELHYRGFEEVDPELEWDPHLLACRRLLERRFEQELRMRTGAPVQRALQQGEQGVDLAGQLHWLIEHMEGPRLAPYLQREASREQMLEFLANRSVYHLKESDPHSFVLPRLSGAAKVALAELQYDEYGAGRPRRLHQTMYGDALAAAGLDRTYGAYVEHTPGSVLAVNNLMSLLCLHQRHRGAAMGHLAAFESTSSAPCRKIAAGIRRLDFPDEVAAYFLEHVEADAVHEQVAVRDLCGRLVAAEPRLHTEVLFGAACCLYLDALAARHTLDAWGAGDSTPIGAGA